MFKRLNLAAIHCTELRIIGHLKISPKLAQLIVDGSHGHVEGKIPYFALYGTVYTLNKIPYVVKAQFQHAEKDYHVEFRYLAEKWPRPPKSIKPAQNLAKLLTEETQDVVLQCDAYFVYKKEDNWSSDIKVPALLEVPKEGEQPFTHIEAIRLSRRENDNVQYSVQIEQVKKGTIKHWVHFTELWKGVLTGEAPMKLLERSNSLSKSLVSKKRERKHGS